MLNLDPTTLISRVFVLIIAFTIHEYSHAWVANRLGDSTPRLAGRLTLNPLVHLDFFGSLLLVLAGFGWAKPVPVNPSNFRGDTRRGMMLVSLAGPLSNFTMAALAAFPLRFDVARQSVLNTAVGIMPSPADFLSEFVIINLVLLLFNLIPLAPLDGEKVAGFFAPPTLLRFYEKIRPYGPIVLLAAFFLGPRLNIDIFGFILNPAISNLWRLLVGA